MKLTEKQMAVLRTLERYGCQQPSAIAERSYIRTSSPRETAARHCINLAKRGLLEKLGTRMYPEWQITPAGRALLAEEKQDA